MKGIIITNSAETSAVYGPVEMREIERRVQIIALPQTADSLSDAPERLREAEAIFSGPGLMRLDDWFLHAAPNLRIVFYAGDADTARAILTPAVSRRGIQFAAVSADADAPPDVAFQPAGARIVAELDRFLAGQPLRWDIVVPPERTAAPVGPSFAGKDRLARAPAATRKAPRFPRPPTPVPAVPAVPVIGPLAPVGAADPPRHSARWWMPSSILVGSVVLHLIFALIAAYCVISVFRLGHHSTFTAGPPQNAPSRNSLEHRVQQYRARAAAALPVARRVVSTSAVAVSLPPLPPMPRDASNVRPVVMSGMGVGGFGFLGRGGSGTGGGGSSGGGGGGGLVG